MDDGGAVQNPPAPLQFSPRGTGLSADEKATLQAAVDRLAAQIASLKPRNRSGPLAERIADAEVYLDAVRRPLNYDERFHAPAGLTPLEHAQRTLMIRGRPRQPVGAGGDALDDAERRPRILLAARWVGAAVLLTLPNQYDPAAKRHYRLDIFMHGRDDQVLKQQFMMKSLTG